MEEAHALATLVEVRGGSSKRLGARAVWTGGSRMIGSLTAGGCVDAEAALAAARVAELGRPEMVRVELGEDGLDFGMSCAGSVRVFVEPLVRIRKQAVAAFEEIRSENVAGRVAHLVLRFDSRSARYAVVTESRNGLRLPSSFMEDADAGLVEEDGTELFFERFAPPPRLLVVGTSPIADPLVRLGKMVGFEVIVVTAQYEDANRFPNADLIRRGIPSDVCSELNPGSDSFVVVTAHDYKHEVPVLQNLAPKSLAYLGFVASRRRGRAVLEFLRTSGSSSAAIDRIHVPVGLDVGSETPEEIAVSIIAELLAVRNGKEGGSMSLTRLESEATAR